MTKHLKQLGVVAVMAAGASPLFGSAILSQSFTTATATGWTLQGSASLTAATTDPSGSGWLRLNSSTANSTGFAYTNTAMSLADGLDIRFQFDNWGSGNTGSNGFSMVLFDGSVATPVAGAAGSLGFAQQSGVAGLTGAILGIGFDELTDAITLRGSGDGTANTLTAANVANYGLIATSGDLTTNSGGNDVILRKKSGNRPTGGGDYREAEVVVDTTQLAQGKLPVRVYLQQGNNAQDQKKWIDVDVYNQMVAYYGSVQNIPSTFKLGFTGVAGASGTVDIHEIQGLTVTSLQTTTSAQTGLPSTTATPEVSTIQLMLGGVLLMGLTGLKRKGVRN